MKKNLRTILILVCLVGLTILAYKLTTSEESSKLSAEGLSDFAIEDTAAIDKIVLTDNYGGDGVTVIRDGNVWVGKDLECIQQHLVTTILETIKHIKVKGPVPKNAVETVNKNLAVHSKNVEIYVNGELTKTWYIGNPTPDHFGTYMLLKDAEKGKSPEPYIMYLPSMHGSLRTRFITDSREFICTSVFQYRPEEIASVDVNYPDSAQNSFTINAIGENRFQLMNGKTVVPRFDTASARNYILGYKKVHFENPNYTLSPEQVDSLNTASPLAILSVTDKSGQTKSIKCYNKKMEYYKMDLNGEAIIWDRDRLWLSLEGRQVVVAQYFVFDKLIQDISIFRPSGLK